MRGARSRGSIVVFGPSMPGVGALSQSPRVSRIVSSKGSLDLSVRPSDFAFSLLALRPQTSSKPRFVPWPFYCGVLGNENCECEIRYRSIDEGSFRSNSQCSVPARFVRQLVPRRTIYETD